MSCWLLSSTTINNYPNSSFKALQKNLYSSILFYCSLEYFTEKEGEGSKMCIIKEIPERILEQVCEFNLYLFPETFLVRL